MSLIQDLTPTNLMQEKEKFFLDQTYNPQFVFAEPIDGQSLTKYGLPQSQYLELAQAILEKSYFHRNEADLFALEGPRVPQTEVNAAVVSFLDMHGLADKYQVIWSSSFVSRASVTADTVKLRLPADFHREGMIGMIYHEIGTHILRRINYEQQVWFKKKKVHGLRDHLLTEEGLAVLHALIPHSFKQAYIAAIRYVAVSIAQKGSFAQVWSALKPYIQDPERHWNVTFRVKRGLSDTSQPGGFTKDLVYLQGMIETWRWLQARDFAIEPLYYGKVAIEDVDKVMALNPDFKPLLPSFFVSDQDTYRQEMSKIGQENFLLE